MKHQSIAFSIHDRDGDTAASGKEDNEFAWDGLFVFASDAENSNDATSLLVQG